MRLLPALLPLLAATPVALATPPLTLTPPATITPINLLADAHDDHDHDSHGHNNAPGHGRPSVHKHHDHAPGHSHARLHEPTETGRFFFNLLDHRSQYNYAFFHHSLTGPGLTIDRHLRLDWIHAENRGSRSDALLGEIEFPIGRLTLEVGTDWVSERGSEDGERFREEGWGAAEIAARHPIFQWVSDDNNIDYTTVFRLTLEAPTGTRFARNDWVIAPTLGHLLRIGDRISILAWSGIEFTVGPDDGGTHAFFYGASFGYHIPREVLALPGIDVITPLFEINGEMTINPRAEGHAIFGVVGFRAALQQIGGITPVIGVGYQFPLDKGARNEQDWAIITSLLLEF